jgi:hypothetical protein
MTTRLTTTPPPPSPSAPSAAQARLLSLLPSGYPAGSCKAESKPMPGSLVSVTCGQNTDTNGPPVSSYGLYADGLRTRERRSDTQRNTVGVAPTCNGVWRVCPQVVDSVGGIAG